MIDLSKIIVEQERLRSMRHQAEQNRLIKSIINEQSKQRGLRDQMLGRLGQSLTSLGLRLQARYGAIVELPSGYVTYYGKQSAKPGC